MASLKRTTNMEEELDDGKMSQPKSSCSVLAIVITLVVLLVIMVSVILFIKFRNYRVIVPQNVTESNQDLASKVEKQIADQSGDESLTITITESDINTLFESYANFPLKDPKAKINENGLTVSGKYGLINVEVLFVPKVTNGKIEYEIKEIKAAGVTAPKKISDVVSAELMNFISLRMPNTKKVYIEKIILKPGFIQATGRKR